MKKVTAALSPLSYRMDGNTVLEISETPIIISDEHAKILEERIASSVVISDVTEEEMEVKKEEEMEVKKEEEMEIKKEEEIVLDLVDGID